MINNENLLENIGVVKDSSIRVKGVGGIVTLDKVGHMLEFGRVRLLDTEGRVNILSLSMVSDKYPVVLKTVQMKQCSARSRDTRLLRLKKAKQAREIMKQLGYPSGRDMINMIVKEMMVNLPITTQYIIKAEEIYGPDVASFKGKTTKLKRKINPNIYVPRNRIYILTYFIGEG